MSTPTTRFVLFAILHANIPSYADLWCFPAASLDVSLILLRDVRVEICRKPEHGVHARHSADVPRVHVTRLTRRVVDEAGIDSGFQVLTFNLQFEVKSTTSFSWYRRKTDFSKI